MAFPFTEEAHGPSPVTQLCEQGKKGLFQGSAHSPGQEEKRMRSRDLRREGVPVDSSPPFFPAASPSAPSITQKVEWCHGQA